MKQGLLTFLLILGSSAPACAIVVSPYFPGPKLQLWMDPDDPLTMEVDDEQRVLSWNDKSANRVKFRATDPDRAPTLVPDFFSPGHSAVLFEPGQYLKAKHPQWSNVKSGEFLSQVRFNTFPRESFILSSADEDRSNGYFMFGVVNASWLGPPYIGIRIRDSERHPSMNGWARAQDLEPLTLDTDYVFSYRGLGAGGGLSHEFRVNGQKARTDYQSNTLMLNTWADDVRGRDNLVLGGFELEPGQYGNEDFYLGHQVAFGPVPSASHSRAVESWLLDHFHQPNDVAVPEPSSVLLAALGGALAVRRWLFRRLIARVFTG